MTDYRTMSGADFQREVGTDPEKWAEALAQEMEANDPPASHAERVEYLARWFADAIEAGRRASIRAAIEAPP